MGFSLTFGATLVGVNLEKLSHCYNWMRFKVGAIFFPLIEPIFRNVDNRALEVRKHFHQGMTGLRQNKPAIALLNLNMVLSLNPNHFLARVYRGRIYISEGRFTLASKDYLQANRINRYRFLHYDLYREYFKSVNKEFSELGTSIVHNFSQAFDALRVAQERMKQDGEKELHPDSAAELSAADSDGEENSAMDNYEELEEEEWCKFNELGPISDREIAKTDWDKLIKELTS